ncbi:MAG: kinase/pyrophosphorylase, partial [Propionibacteriaceae bacterium]|nr:kinase/pyrophosphorylase [Propionibacteriaceae bacterium]
MSETIEIHVIADSTGESAVRIARAARAQFPEANFEIVRHPRVGRTEAMLKALETLKERANHPIAVFFTLVNDELRSLVINACRDLGLPYVDLMGDALRALEKVSGLPADQVAMRPVGVEADYFVRISAMEFAVRNDDGAIPEALRECDICL